MSDLAMRVAERQAKPEPTSGFITLDRANGGTQLRMTQSFDGHSVSSETMDPRAFAPFVERTARFSGATRFEVDAGATDPVTQPSSNNQLLDPLLVNAVLNALKHGGATEIEYRGQALFTGKGPAEYMLPSALQVKLVLRPQEIDGELPDRANGWTAGRSLRNNEWVVRARKESTLQETPAGPDAYAAEIARLAALPPDEFEKEIAKKDRLLQKRFRTAVEEAKAKRN
jgi:hypothetical protein